KIDSTPNCIKKADPRSNIKKGQIVMALIVTIKKENKEPVGTRIFVPVLAEFDYWGYKKVFSLAPEVL
ncbi:23456_t:CDS:2, partial [Racocetra persica]